MRAFQGLLHFSMAPFSHFRFFIFVFLLLLPAGLTAQTAALSGLINDRASKKPLSGATVRLVGTTAGAVSDKNGRYFVRKLSPSAVYTVEISLIGYKKIQKTGVKVSAGDTLRLNFLMDESAVAVGQEITVIGEKPLVDVEETQSINSVGRQQIERMSAQNVTDVITRQTGFVTQNREIFIRGGRGYEAAYLLDGVSVQDPLAGSGFGLQFAADALDQVEIITGGFNPEYGQATSGIVNIKTRDGGDKYSGAATIKRAWRIFERNKYVRDTSSSFVTDMAELYVGGPEPITSYALPALGVELPGKVSAFLSVAGNASDDFAPEFARVKLRSAILPSFVSMRMDNSLNITGKLTWRISPSMKLTYSHNRSMALNQNSRSVQTNLEYVVPDPGYQYNFQGNFDGAITYSTDQRINTLTWFHNTSTSTFYEIRLSDFTSHLKADANGRSYSEYIEPRDIPTIPAQYFTTKDSNRLGIIPGDGFYDIGNGSIWREHFINELTFRGDATTYLAEKNSIKAGAELRIQKLQQAEIYAPWLGSLGLNNDIFATTAYVGALYVQNNISLKGLVLNYGARLDLWAPGELADAAIENPDIPTVPDAQRENYRNTTFDMFGRRWKARLSPRLGVSHPVTDNQTLFFNYGHFNKLPRPQFVYAKLAPQAANSSFQRFGNPDLNPETTIAYELGLKNQITENDVLTITAYYKDIFDYIQSRRAVNTNPRLIGGSFLTYINSDYARSRGLEVEYKKRVGSWFDGMISASYSVVTGKSSGAEQGTLIARGLTAERITEDYMPWDRPLNISVSMNFHAAKDDPILGIKGFDDINCFVRMSVQSGQRYTPYTPVIDPTTGKQLLLPDGRPSYQIDEKQTYAAVGEPWRNVDINIKKKAEFDNVRLTFSLDVFNLLDFKNSTILNPVTGRAYEYGDSTPLGLNDPLYPDLQSPLSPYPFNPARYTSRRSLRLGVSAGF